MSILTSPAPQAPSTPPSAPSSTAYRPDLRRSRLALWSADHRWTVLTASVLALVTGLWLMLTVGITVADFEDNLVGDSRAASELLEADFGEQPTELVILTDPEGPIAETDLLPLGEELVGTFEGVDGVHAVGTPFPGQDGSLLLPVEPATAGLADAHPELTVGQFGATSLDDQINTQLGDDFLRAELFAIPITLAVLLIAFGAVVAAGVPLVLGLGDRAHTGPRWLPHLAH